MNKKISGIIVKTDGGMGVEWTALNGKTKRCSLARKHLTESLYNLDENTLIGMDVWFYHYNTEADQVTEKENDTWIKPKMTETLPDNHLGEQPVVPTSSPRDEASSESSGEVRPESTSAESVFVDPYPHPENERRGQHSSNSFVYPYNFIRVSDNHPSNYNKCKPVGHGRFYPELLSGKIRFTINPLSPWHLPEPQPWKTEDKEKSPDSLFHKDENGSPILTVTSLKGMLRSTFEAVTDSCFSVFTWPKQRNNESGLADSRSYEDYLSMRYSTSRGKHDGIVRQFRPGRIVRHNDAWKIQPCKSYKFVKDSGEPPCLEEGAGISVKIDLDGRSCSVDRSSKKIGFVKRSWRVKMKDADTGTHNWDRVFIPNGSLISITTADIDAFERLIKEQGSHKSDSYSRGYDFLKSKCSSNFNPDGELIYYRELPEVLRGNDAHGAYLHHYEIARTAIPRVSQRRSVVDCLPIAYRPCQNADALCPACRLFGMAGKHVEKAYKGQIRILTPEWIGKPESPNGTYLENVPLKILSSPHVARSNFYLIDNKHRNNDEVAYDYPNAIVRGRKRYWVRLGTKPADYTIQATHPYRGSSQHITAELLIGNSGRFDAELIFENLQDWELGALLFALELPWNDSQGVHQIGHGKPLGLGLCSINVTKLEWLAMRDRYLSLDCSGHDVMKDEQVAIEKKVLVEAYKNCMLELTGHKEYMDIEFIKDLKELTTFQAFSVRYPEFNIPQHENLTTQDRRKLLADKTFAWFNGSKKDTKCIEYFDAKEPSNRNTHQARNRRDTPLPLPGEAKDRPWHRDEG